MFNKSKSEAVENNGAASLISSGTTLTGNIECNSDLRIDGTLIGNIISTAKVIIGANGMVQGDIVGLQADILGKVTGTIKVKELLQLKGSSVVHGDIHSSKLQIEPSASFNGACHMSSAEAMDLNITVDDDTLESSRIQKRSKSMVA
jgi:cytoskeletal protein CcmA (bactofilin family)